MQHNYLKSFDPLIDRDDIRIEEQLHEKQIQQNLIKHGIRYNCQPILVFGITKNKKR